MKRLLTTTAIVAMTAMPLAAEQHSASGGSEMSVNVGSEEVRVSNMMDTKVYMPQDGSTEDLSSMEISEVPENWTEIGTISDVFVDTSGNVSTVVLTPSDAANVQAEKVGLKVDSMTIKKGQNGDQIFVVYTGDKVSLEESQEFDEEQAKQEGQQSVSEQSEMAKSDSDQMEKSESDEMEKAESDQMEKSDGQQNDQAMASGQDAQTSSNGLTIYAADLTGHAVYIPGEGSTGDEIPTELAEADDTWERVGEISSVILTREGEIKSVTLDAGGFLGMGEKEVETSMDELKFVADSDSDADNEWFVVYTGDRSALEEKEEYDEQASQERGEQRMTGEDMAKSDQQREAEQDSAEADQAEADPAAGEQDTAEADQAEADPAAGEQDTAEADQAEADPAAADDGQGQVMLSAEELDGAPVYDSNGDEIGNVSELMLNDNGEIDTVIIDVGGFLGLGEKPVAIKYNELQIDEDVDTAFGDVRVSVSHTREELDQMERWTE